MPLLTTVLLLASAQVKSTGFSDPNVFVPSSSIARPGDRGKRVHTNYMLWVGPNGQAVALSGPGSKASAPPGPNGGFTPADIRTAYGDTAQGQGIIAIVDAYDDPNALNDFNVFSSQFGLPTEPSGNALSSSNKVFQVVYATGSEPAVDPTGGWEGEVAIDIEWAHAMAPGAKIVLVEAADESYDSLLAGVTVAVQQGASEVSMSWIGQEFEGEQAYDAYFGYRSVRFFAASGDGGAGVGYPSTSPDVISCGGTSLTLGANGYVSESAWPGSGGGSSAYEAIPSYQQGLQAYNASNQLVPITGRANPDVSAVADANTGVAIYNSYGGNSWGVAGGTSVATPVIAGLCNASSTIHRSSEWFWIYDNANLFHDIVTGNTGYPAGVGYDYATGMGSPKVANSL